MADLSSILDLDKNLDYNRRCWGSRDKWEGRDSYGYRWGNGIQQASSAMSRFADAFLRPYLNERYDYRILELSPGAGRFTAELIRYAASLDLLDMNQACLDICKERFRYCPLEIGFFLNDGRSCDVLGNRTYDLIASFDSLVHMHPDIIHGYVIQLAERLDQDGIMWLDHSGKGIRGQGHRTDMTAEKMMQIGAECGLSVLGQRFRNSHDCVTVFGK